MNHVDEIYASMIGELIIPCEGVKDEYAPGSYCDRLYNTAWEARNRLADRLGAEEDADLELIFDSFCDIASYLCHRMYEYGANDRLSLCEVKIKRK